ncbi:MAG: peptidylprolyl isomerase, partial [Patescibacteria group bacterium]
MRWAVFGILVLFLASAFLDVIGFKNAAADKLDQGISRIPVLNQLRVWPLFLNDAGSKRLVWKNIQEIDLNSYGRSFRLGLDLLGGTHLVYQADTSKLDLGEKADALSGVRDVIERRVNALGVSEPLVQTNQVGTDWRVIVELAGVYDVNSAIKMIGETPLLEFKEENPQAIKLTPGQQKQLDEENQKVKEKAEGVLGKILAGADFVQLANDNSDDPGSKDNGGLYTGVTKGMFVPEFEDVLFNKLKAGETYPQLVLTQFGYHVIRKEAETGEGDDRKIDTRHILFKIKTAQDLGVNVDSEWKNTELTGQQLKKATVVMDPNSGIPQVSLEFNTEGSKLFGEITGRNVGKPVAIFLDNYPISIPRVNEAITSGQAVISGDFNLKEAKLLAQRLNAGALPVPINLISQTTVGATLGGESVQKSLIAGLWGLLFVALFMILFYRFPGFLSVLALLVYTTLA